MAYSSIVGRPRKWLPVAAAALLAVASISGAQSDPTSGTPSSGSSSGSLAGANGSAVTGITEPSVSVKLGFDTRGVVGKVDVRRNDRVKAGQSLLRLDDREEAATLEYYKKRADTALQVAEAEQTYSVKKIDYERKLSMFNKGQVATDFEVKTAEAEMNIAKIRIDQARHEGDVAAAQADAQAARVQKMHKISPIDGEVRDVIVKVGEQVDESKPVIEIVDLDPLYVEVTLVDTGVVQRLKLGDKLMVKYADEMNWREATVESIDPSADRRSGKHPFRLTLPNPDNRNAGLRVDVQLPPSVASVK
jgi:RND family efflux transporter MFP subunit